MNNRWMPDEYRSGNELYHYGVKGMKWKNKKGSTEAQEAMTGVAGGVVNDNGDAYSFRNGYRTMYINSKAAINREKNRPEWQKKWNRSSAKKTLKSIMSKVKSRMPKNTKKKKRKITVY